MRDRGTGDDSSQPDPTADAWSAWLPRLDTPTTPLPQASAPPDPAPPDPAPLDPAPLDPAPLDPAPSGPPPRPQPSWYAATPPPAPAPPTQGAPQRHTQPPPTRLGLALLCLFCFTPFAVIAIVKSMAVRPLWAQGRWDEAYRTSRSVKNWCILAALVWPGSAILFACSAVLGWM